MLLILPKMFFFNREFRSLSYKLYKLYTFVAAFCAAKSFKSFTTPFAYSFNPVKTFPARAHLYFLSPCRPSSHLSNSLQNSLRPTFRVARSTNFSSSHWMFMPNIQLKKMSMAQIWTQMLLRYLHDSHRSGFARRAKIHGPSVRLYFVLGHSLNAIFVKQKKKKTQIYLSFQVTQRPGVNPLQRIFCQWLFRPLRLQIHPS